MNITRERLVIYTAIVGDVDVLHEPLHRLPDADYVCFTDNPQLRSGIFSIYPLPFQEIHPQLTARHIKLVPHLLFPGHDISLWIDGCQQPVADLAPLIKAGLDGHDMACLSHPDRNCLYDEATHCARTGRANPQVLQAQAGHYRSQKMPEKFGLFYTGVILRRHHSPAVKAAMEDWWHEIQRHSRRDQVSLPYVLWERRMPVNSLSYDHWHDRLFLSYPHRTYPPGDNRNHWLFRLRASLFSGIRRFGFNGPYRWTRHLWRSITRASSG